jgi:uncharacterized membrane protein
MIVIKHAEGADHAYADVLSERGDAPGSMRSRSSSTNFAGRYVNYDEEGDLIGNRTAEGALTGAVAGVIFGPPGLAVGMVGGATAGGISESHHAPHLHDAFLDEVRADVPERSSGVLLLAAPEHVDAMVAAFEGHDGRLVRRELSAEADLELERAVAGSPRAVR